MEGGEWEIQDLLQLLLLLLLLAAGGTGVGRGHVGKMAPASSPPPLSSSFARSLSSGQRAQMPPLSPPPSPSPSRLQSSPASPVVLSPAHQMESQRLLGCGLLLPERLLLLAFRPLLPLVPCCPLLWPCW